jgi:hypothetical protein
MRFAPVVLLALGLAFPAHAMLAFHWETDTGTLAYADEKDRVPARYADRAKLIDVPSLHDYARLTISERSRLVAAAPAVPAAPAPEMEALQGGALRVGPAMVAPQTIFVQAGDGVLLPVPAAGLDPTLPIRVEKRVYRWEDGLAYPFTIVKQGDRILVEIREEL